MIKCAVTVARFARLAAAPVRPLLGSGAVVGPIRAIAVIACVAVGAPAASPSDMPANPTRAEIAQVPGRLLTPPSLPPERSVSPLAPRVAPSVPAAASGHLNTSVVTVPEPASLALLVLGVGALAMCRRCQHVR